MQRPDLPSEYEKTTATSVRAFVAGVLRHSASSTIVHHIYGRWTGWRMAGRDPVSPEGDRSNPRRQTSLLWVERNRTRFLKIPGYRASLPMSPFRHGNASKAVPDVIYLQAS